MYWKGHYGINLLLAAPFTAALTFTGSPHLGYLFTGCMLATATGPDIDQDIPFIKHRGPTHTVWFALIVGELFGVSVSGLIPVTALPLDLSQIAFGVVIFLGTTAGMLGHLLGDYITHSGIQPFAPLTTQTYTCNWTTAAHTGWNIGLFVVGILLWGLATQTPTHLIGLPVA